MDESNCNVETEPLSMEEPVDWYYDEVGEHGFSTECVFLIFGEYLCNHDLCVRMQGVLFSGLKPDVESETMELEIVESDYDSEYALIKLQAGSKIPEEYGFRAHFNCDFNFSFFETDVNGEIVELDYSDIYCMK